MSSIAERLRDRIDATIPPLIDGTPRRIALLDAPDYPNVGDPAILLGELAFLRRVYPGTAVTIVSHRTHDAAVDSEIEGADCLFLHGGGSFGDIWPLHHDFRLHILRRFADKPIVHFPQSFHFRDEAVLDATKRAIAGAGNFILLARDAKGFEFAKAHFDCRVELCPDMAFAMGPLDGGRPTLDYACVLRTDKEVLADKTAAIAATLSASGASFAIDDWLENRVGIEKVHGLARLMLRKGLPANLFARHGLTVFELYARSRLRFGLSLLGRGRTVVTDRLHGQILATLIGRPRIIFDSLDGKVRAFNRTWLADDPGAVFLDDAAALRDLVGRKAAA